MNRPPRIAWRLVAVYVLLLVQACAPAALRPVDGVGLPRQALIETITAAYTNISQKYIEPIALDAVALRGLRGLASIDPTLSIERDGSSIVLSSPETVVRRFPVPENSGPGAWAALTTDVLDAGRGASRDLSVAGIDTVYEAVFDGALSDLDSFSRYAGAAEAKRSRARREGFGGVGIRLRLTDGVFRITHVQPGAPAAHAGVQARDSITHIDGIPTQGMSQPDAIDKIRGPVKSLIVLSVARPGTTEPLRFELRREHIVPATVNVVDRDGVAVVTITGFNQNTAKSLAAKLKPLRRRVGGTMKGVVLDLRGNPGGLLKQSVRVADQFLVQGDILNTRGRHPDSFQHYEAGGGDLTDGLPLVLLIDGKSASAAEIVAAALVDRRRAVIVGTSSFGKGTVQTVIRLPNDGEITLTWSRLITPAGYALHGLGVLPNLCTSGDHNGNRKDPAAALGTLRTDVSGTIAAWRTVGLHDEDGRSALRATCPAERRHGDNDRRLAVRVAADRVLYQRIIDSVATTTAAEQPAQ